VFHHYIQGFQVTMNDVLTVRGSNSCSKSGDEVPRSLNGHRTFALHNVVKRCPLDEFHDEERHLPPAHAEVSYRNYVLMANSSRGQCFLAKPRREHRIISHEIREDNFDSVKCFEIC